MAARSEASPADIAHLDRYLQAIVHCRALRSLRDLTSHHLPMLCNLRKQATSSAQRFGLRDDQVRCYVHYQPSYCALSFARAFRSTFQADDLQTTSMSTS